MLFFVFKECVLVVFFFIKRHLAIAVVGQRLQGQIALVLEIWFRRHLLLLLASDVADGMRLHPVRWHQVQWHHRLQEHLTLLMALHMELHMLHLQSWHQVELHLLGQRLWQWPHQHQVINAICSGEKYTRVLLIDILWESTWDREFACCLLWGSCVRTQEWKDCTHKAAHCHCN